jgi:hypothetical protein
MTNSIWRSALLLTDVRSRPQVLSYTSDGWRLKVSYMLYWLCDVSYRKAASCCVEWFTGSMLALYTQANEYDRNIPKRTQMKTGFGAVCTGQCVCNKTIWNPPQTSCHVMAVQQDSYDSLRTLPVGLTYLACFRCLESTKVCLRDHIPIWVYVKPMYTQLSNVWTDQYEICCMHCGGPPKKPESWVMIRWLILHAVPYLRKSLC